MMMMSGVTSFHFTNQGQNLGKRTRSIQKTLPQKIVYQPFFYRYGKRVLPKKKTSNKIKRGHSADN